MKNTTLILLRGSPLILSEVGHGKTKPNRWVKSSPKMRHLHRCQSLQKFSKYEKTTETYWLRSSPPSTPISVSRRLKVKRLGAKLCVAFLLFSFERIYDVLKSRLLCILLNKNINFNKNETGSKTGNPTQDLEGQIRPFILAEGNFF